MLSRAYAMYLGYDGDMHKMKVQVTQPLIDRATARDSRHCMIAEAMTTAHPHLKAVVVDLATIRWSNPKTGKRYIALTPEIAAARLVDFDQGNPVDPFSFNLAAMQVTEMKKRKETDAEARAEGRKSARQQPQRKAAKTIEMIGGQPVVVGGRPMPGGHLSNVPPPVVGPREAPSAHASNVTRSSRRYRQYGRRLLKG